VVAICTKFFMITADTTTTVMTATDTTAAAPTAVTRFKISDFNSLLLNS